MIVKREKTCVVVLLLIYFAALTGEAWWLTITADEPSHLISSHLYWKGRDRLYPRDVPPLMKIAGGWPSLFFQLPLPPDLGAPGDTRQEWSAAAELIGQLARTPDVLQRYLFCSRLALSVFPLAAAFVLWRWARELFGPSTALAVIPMWILCPLPLGHGALFKNDIAAASTYILCWYAAWRYWRNRGVILAITMGVACALVTLSKNSMLFLLPFGALVVLLRAWSGEKQRTLIDLAAVSITSLAVLYLAWPHDWHFVTPQELERLARMRNAPPHWFLDTASVLRSVPIPEGLWTGVVSLFQANSAFVPVYMLEQIYPTGHRGYFLLATLLKMPWPLLLLSVAGFALLLRRHLQGADWFWILPGPLYFGLASLSNLQLGARLVLPAWIFFALIAGLAIQRLLRHRVGQAIVLASVTLTGVFAVTSFPHGLSFFNPFFGNHREIVRYLADSNIDWGQALRDTARYANKHRVPVMKLYVFGYDPPSRHFQPGRYEVMVPPWSPNANTPRRAPVSPGWYAISATLLPGHFFLPEYREYFAEFRNREPVATVGGSVFIYRVE